MFLFRSWLFDWITVFFVSFSAGQNVCPRTDILEWPVGSTVSPYYDDTRSPVHSESWRESWMSQLDDSTSFNDVTIPGTHQTGALYWTGWAQCNTWWLSNQLRAGLRFFDLRTNLIWNEIQIWHGVVSQNHCLDNAIEEIIKFLNLNPEEFVLMRLTHVGDMDSDNTLNFTEAVWNVTDQYDQSYFWKNAQLPSTVGAVRRKLVILRQWESTAMWGPEYGQSSFITDDWSVESSADLEEKWSGIVEHLDAVPTGDPGTMFIVYISGAGLLWTPSRVAMETNSRLHSYLPSLEIPSRRGVILFDYPGYDVIGDVIRFNADVRAMIHNNM